MRQNIFPQPNAASFKNPLLRAGHRLQHHISVPNWSRPSEVSRPPALPSANVGTNPRRDAPNPSLTLPLPSPSLPPRRETNVFLEICCRPLSHHPLFRRGNHFARLRRPGG